MTDNFDDDDFDKEYDDLDDEVDDGDYDDNVEVSCEEDLEGWLAEVLENEPIVKKVKTFKEAHLLTNNYGLVVRIGSREFQLTIVER